MENHTIRARYLTAPLTPAVLLLGLPWLTVDSRRGASGRGNRHMRTIRWFTFVLSMVLAPTYVAAGTILDPSGDSMSNDIVSVDGAFDATALYLTASFAPGTLDPTNLGFVFGLDLDLDPDTGIDCGGPTFFPCGAEWYVFFNSQLDPANVITFDSEGSLLTTFPVAFDSDGLRIAVPLNPDPAIGLPDDGFALFGLVVGVPISAEAFEVYDIAPGSAVNGPLGGPTMWAGDIAIAPNDGTDYTDRILVVTGKSTEVESRCGVNVEFFKTIAIDVNGGPALITEVGYISSSLDNIGPGNRFDVLATFPCNDIDFVQLSLGKQ